MIHIPPGQGGVDVSVAVEVGGSGVSVQVEVGVCVAVGGTGVLVRVQVGIGVMEAVQVGGMNRVDVRVGVPVRVGVRVAVAVAVWLGVRVFNTGVTDKFKVDVGERDEVGVPCVLPLLGATMIATRPTQ